MKTRNGFVSNSSSSSFIINGKIEDVANSMLDTVIEDFSDWGNERLSKKDKAEYTKWQKNLKTALENKDVMSGKIGITMPSCNYETYIIKVGDEVHVSTANNHQWNLDYSKSGMGADDGEDDIVYKTLDGRDFFNVKNKIVHGQEEWMGKDKCKNKKCIYSSSYVICNDGKKLCAHCYKEMK